MVGEALAEVILVLFRGTGDLFHSRSDSAHASTAMPAGGEVRFDAFARASVQFTVKVGDQIFVLEVAVIGA